MDARNVKSILKWTSDLLGLRGNDVQSISKFDIVNPIFEAEILPIPAIKTALEYKESF